MGTIVVLIVLGVFGLLFVIFLNASEKKDELRGLVRAMPNFASCEVLCSSSAAIAVSSAASAFGVAWRDGQLARSKEISASQLLEVSVERVGSNGKTKKVGFGVFSTENYASQVNLTVRLKDAEIPILRIPLYVLVGKPDGMARLSEDNAVKLGQQWESLITGASFGTSVPPNLAPLPEGKTGVATELQILHDLFASGALTEEEFREAKLRALAAR